MYQINKVLALSCISTLLLGCSYDLKNSTTTNHLLIENKPWQKIKSDVITDPFIEEKVNALLKTMTIEQKVAQMIQPEIRDITVEDMRRYGFGSYLNGGGAFPNGNKHSTPQDWIALAEKMYQASIDNSLDGTSIPTMWGTDAVHGHNNVIGATLFPHNIGLGAANNSALVEQIAKITATEVMVTGIDWVFAPTVATVRDDRWGRTYEGYSEDPEIVKRYAGAVVKGLQGSANDNFLGDDRVISTVKHFLGDGGTLNGDDQGDNQSTEHDLYKIHAQGYVSGLAAGAQSVMASFNSWHGEKIHGNKYLLTTVLKEKMGFDGFVVGDWNGHGQVKGCTNESCPQAINAGLDIFMVPTDAWKPLMLNTIEQAQRGDIAMSRIDDAVKRILRVKFRAGLFEKPSPEKRLFSGRTELIGSEKHRKVAQQAVRESLVLLKNKDNLLPLSPKLNILVAGDGAHNVGKQSGGWSITWQGTGNKNSDFPGGTSIYDGIAKQVSQAGGKTTLSIDGSFKDKPDVAVVVFGEEPYAEGQGDIEHLSFQQVDKASLALLTHFKQQNIPVVSLFISGRPMWVNAELNASDAFVAIWLPGSEGEGVADVILVNNKEEAQYDFTGKLSFSWPNTATQTRVNRYDEDYAPLFPYGYGLTYQDNDTLSDDLDETMMSNTHGIQAGHAIHPLFKDSIQKPWQLWLFSDDKSMAVNANTHHVSHLRYRTIDKEVQEDAFKIKLDDSNQYSGVMIKQSYALFENFESHIYNESALQFSVNLANKPVGDIILSLSCSGYETCGDSYNITQNFKQLPIGEWQEFSIDLGCFTQNEMDFSRVTSPFALASTGALEMSLSDIVIVSDYKSKALIRCH